MRTDKMKQSEPIDKEKEALKDLEFALDYLGKTEHLMDCCLIVEGRAYEVVQAWNRLKEVRGKK